MIPPAIRVVKGSCDLAQLLKVRQYVTLPRNNLTNGIL